jgi:DNA helicase II / ATP-dependent DNA helicase PcrA
MLQAVWRGTLGDVIRRSVSQPELPMAAAFVRVMSLHKSKGLTADLVVVCGCLQGLIPSIDGDASMQQQQRSVEEQRRLFYVAITRTRRTLVLSSVTGLPFAVAQRMRARAHRSTRSTATTMASQFIHELGPQCPSAMSGQRFLTRVGVRV